MILVVQQLSDAGRAIYDYGKLFFKFCLSKYLEEPDFYESIRKRGILIIFYREKQM